MPSLKPTRFGHSSARRSNARRCAGHARAAAEQFAKDSRSALGEIRRASQGVFVILPRDQAPGINESAQLQKIVRLVSTVQYALR